MSTHCADLSNLEGLMASFQPKHAHGHLAREYCSSCWIYKALYPSPTPLSILFLLPDTQIYTIDYLHYGYTTTVYNISTSTPYPPTYYVYSINMCGPPRASSGGRIAVVFPSSPSKSNINSYSVLFHNHNHNTAPQETTKATFRACKNDSSTLDVLRGSSSIDLRIEYAYTSFPLISTAPSILLKQIDIY